MAYIDYYIVQYFMTVTFFHIFCQSLKFYSAELYLQSMF